MGPKTFLKICGITNIDDVRLVSASGADYCGILVDVSFSERSLTLHQAFEVAMESTIPTVILLCDPNMKKAVEVAEAIQPFAIQLLCYESPGFVKELRDLITCQIWKTIHLPIVPGQSTPEDYAAAGANALLVDSIDESEGFLRIGGTGKTTDWKASAYVVKSVSIPVFLAGGIFPENIQEAIAQVNPYGIDLCSGVEASKGKKDPEKLQRLVKNLKSAIKPIRS